MGEARKKNDYFFHFFRYLDFVFFSSIAGVQCLFQPFRKDIQAIDCAIFIPICGHFGWTLDSSQTDSWHFGRNHVPKSVLNLGKDRWNSRKHADSQLQLAQNSQLHRNLWAKLARQKKIQPNPSILCASYVHPMHPMRILCASYVHHMCILCASYAPYVPYVHPMRILLALCASYAHPMCILCASYAPYAYPMCILCASSVSYTHLTLPTNREV